MHHRPHTTTPGPTHGLNGWPGSPPPSTMFDILLDIRGQIGGLQTGQHLTLQAVETAFDRMGAQDRRLTTVEARLAQVGPATMPSSPAPPTPASHGPQPTPPRDTLTALTGLLKALGELLPSLRECLVWATIMLLLARGVVAPTTVLDALGKLSGLNSSTPACGSPPESSASPHSSGC